MHADEPTSGSAPSPIAAGTVIGSYRIERLLGKGGMGSVYRALDEKLNRPVALKFIGAALIDDEARRRFQREVRMASSLNHPHILTVHDVGEHEGRQYLVTELVDGGTLRDWARGEPRSTRQIAELMTGVADGLAAAHDAGILHRDIKPANILVARNGYAKLADFGLAKLADRPEPSDVTVTRAPHTHSGLILGTLAYMSPEQAAGRTLDARSDIFSFGVVLYELLAGKRPFEGASDLEVLQAIAFRAPSPLGDHIPPPLRATVEKALEKEPADRYQSMRDVVVDLRRAARQGDSVASAADLSTPSRRAWRPSALAIAATVAVAATGIWFLTRQAPGPSNPLDGAIFTRLTDFPGDELGASLSRDGQFVTFYSDRDGRPDLWMRQVGSSAFRNLTKDLAPGAYTTRDPPGGFTFDRSQVWLTGTVSTRLSLLPLAGGAPQPFLPERAGSLDWSPDGTRVVYNLNTPGDPIFVATADGANPRRIFGAEDGLHNHFPIWSTDSRWIYFARGQVVTFQFDLWRVPADGGQAEQLTRHNAVVAYPAAIDDRTVLYVAEDQGAGPWLWAYDAETRTTRRVSVGLDRYTSVAASADGRRLVVSVANPVANLWRVPILERVAQAEEARPYPVSTTRALAPSFGPDALFYLSSLDAGDGLWRWQGGQAVEIWKGTDAPLTEPPAISPDGQDVAIVVNERGRYRLRLLRADGSATSKAITDSLEVRGAPAWSPDGQWLVTGGNDGSADGLFKVPVDGTAPVRLADGLAFNPEWSKSRPLIVYAGPNVGALQRLLAVTPDGAPADFPAITVSGEGVLHRLTPDGNGVVYFAASGATVEFWMLDLPTGRRRVLTNVNAGRNHRAFDITPDGTAIVFDQLRQSSDIHLIDLPR